MTAHPPPSSERPPTSVGPGTPGGIDGSRHHRSGNGADWTGWRGKLHAWFFSTWSRKAFELLVFGNYWPAFKRECRRRLRTGRETVLDVGAGSGNFSLPIARRLAGGRLFCLDTSTTMTDHLLWLATRAGIERPIRVLTRDAGDTGLPTGSIDWLVCGNCLHELADPAPVFAEFRRVLAAHGTVFVVDFRDRHGYHPGTHGPYSVAQMRAYLAAAGFAEIRVIPERHFVIATARAGDAMPATTHPHEARPPEPPVTPPTRP